MSLEYADEYQAVGIEYTETFTDFGTAKTALLAAWSAAYPATVDSPLFVLSCSEILGNTGETITKFDPAVSRPETARIRVTDTTGFTDTVLFGYLLQYLQKRADALKDRDAVIWNVLRKGVDTETGDTSWVSVYTASMSDL